MQMQIQVELKRSKSLLEKTIEAVVCQIFSLLTAPEHWKLSSTSHKLKNISRSIQASPRQVEIPLGTDPKVDDHLLQLQPQTLTLHFDKTSSIISIRSIESTKMSEAKAEKIARMIKMPSMGRLRELTFVDDDRYFEDPCPLNMEWCSQLTNSTNLVKMSIPDGYLATLLSLQLLQYLPSSLTHLHVPGNNTSVFSYISNGILSRLFDSPNLSALQVLKLPRNRFYLKEILNIGTALLQLREFGFGYVGGHNQRAVSLSPLQSAINLESLTIGVDTDETIPQWDTLAPLSSLRRLTVILFHHLTLPSTLFDGLSKVRQLTSLKLIPHSPHLRTDISAAIFELTRSGTIYNDQEVIVLPQLTTLLIDRNFHLSSAACLSVFTSLTELELPFSTRVFPNVGRLPLLRTLHTISWSILNHYKDQLHTLIYKCVSLNSETSSILRILSTMKHLCTLKLDPRCALPDKRNDNLSLSDVIRRGILPTTQIEIDTSIEDEQYYLG